MAFTSVRAFLISQKFAHLFFRRSRLFGDVKPILFMRSHGFCSFSLPLSLATRRLVSVSKKSNFKALLAELLGNKEALFCLLLMLLIPFLDFRLMIFEGLALLRLDATDIIRCVTLLRFAYPSFSFCLLLLFSV